LSLQTPSRLAPSPIKRLANPRSRASLARMLVIFVSWLVSVTNQAAAVDSGALAGDRHRVLVSTDIGGTDFDDFQSLVHLFLYADSFDVEGLISSPYGQGRKEHILKVIDCYERDYANLKSYSERYPTPAALRAITKQGALESAGSAGFDVPTEGSQWIIQCAHRDDPRPLYVLIWGGIDDLAQALHDAPDILPKLRVYFIGGPNKKWSVDAYNYIEQNHPQLWIIEANATYVGWFIGGNQSGDFGNVSFVAAHVAGHGALGEFFAKGIRFDAKTQSAVKMGDTPSVAYLLHGKPRDPSQESWGGQFVRAWERPHKHFDRLTTAADEMEQFGVFELALSVVDRASGQPEAQMQIENQSLKGFVDAKGALRFRFSPKEAKVYHYTIRANAPGLDGKSGALTSVRPPVDAARRPSALLPHWWTDDPAPAVAEGPHIGAKTVSRWRQDFLGDFAARLLRCKSPAPP
jgi:cellulose-binding protein